MLSSGDLRAFLAGYEECAAWAGLYWPGEDEEPVPIDSLDEDFAPGERARLLLGPARWAKANARALLLAERYGRPMAHLGHDFLLTRAGHGTGFWDRDLPRRLRDHLTARALEDRASPTAYSTPSGLRWDDV